MRKTAGSCSWGTLALLVGLLVAGVIGCEPAQRPSDASDASTRTINVVATVGMVADVVREIAGDRATVTMLIGTGVDPHTYRPTRGDALKLDDADLVFYNGLLLEGQMTAALESPAREGQRKVSVTSELFARGNYLLPGEEKPHDPHVWMDVRGWIEAARVIEATLIAHDPDHADAYRARAQSYVDKLERLDAYAREVISSIPQERRVLITAHDAFQYFGRAYGIEVRGIQGMSTEAEAGVRDIEQLIDFIVERKVPAVFVETSVAEKNVRALVEGAAVRGHALTIGASLFSDAMGEAGSYEGTYVGMIDHNATSIARALGGTVPEGGFRNWKPD